MLPSVVDALTPVLRGEMKKGKQRIEMGWRRASIWEDMEYQYQCHVACIYSSLFTTNGSTTRKKNKESSSLTK